MSDAAITSIVTGLVTITTIVVGFLTLWVKVKYGVAKAEEVAARTNSVEKKIDDNTVISTQAKVAAQQAERQTNGVMSRYEDQVADHGARISALEEKVATIKSSMDMVTKNIDSTRHEVRGHFQTVMNKLETVTLGMMTKPPVTNVPDPSPTAQAREGK